MRAHMIMLLAFALAWGCGRDGSQCPSLADDPSWRDLDAAMNLPAPRQRRLADYVATLEASSCQIAKLAPEPRARASALLAREISRSIQLFVPPNHREQAHAQLRETLRLQ